MKTLAGACLGLVMLVAPAVAMVIPTAVPEEVSTDEPFTITFDYDSGGACNHFQGTQTSQEGLVQIIEITTLFDLPPEGFCTGLHDMFMFDEDFVCDEPGLLTLRVIEHNARPDLPDWPDEVEEFQFMVTGTVPAESVSFGAIKAHYR